MKIGILTYHQAHNYGAILQAIALRKVLGSLGNEAYFINYIPDYHKREYILFNKDYFRQCNLKRKIKYGIRCLLKYIPYRWRKHKFNSYVRNSVLRFSKPLSESFDVVIYGSDQIWRVQPYIGEYDSTFFGGNEIPAKLHASYAASLDCLPQTKEDTEVFCNLLHHLDKISVRESQTKLFLEENGFTNVSLSLDPTLLLTKKQWEEIVPTKRIIKQKYILLFDLLADCGSISFNEAEVAEFANRNDTILIKLRANLLYTNSLKGRLFDTPVDFVNLIRYAECVITSSYHGLVFSVIMERPVYCCFPTSNSRTESLLNVIDIQERMLDPKNPELPRYIELINYHSIKEKIDNVKKSSIEYLEFLNC